MPISQDFKIKTLNDNITAREQEVYAYELNIGNFQRMVAKLPSEWTANVVQYKDSELSDVPDELKLEVNQHRQRDMLKKRILDEQVQMSNAQLVLEVLQDQLDEMA